MNKPILTIITIVMVGCSNNRAQPIHPEDQVLRYHYFWSKDGATSADFTKDLYECETTIQQRILMATNAMNQYKYSRMNMGVFGFGLEEPEEIDEESIPSMLPKCLEGHAWKLTKKTSFILGPNDDEDEVMDTHNFAPN